MSTILECNGLTKKFGSKVAVSGIDLKIDRGQIVGLLGPNASGKSTILKLANELLTPTSGTILIGGKQPLRLEEATFSKFIHESFVYGWVSNFRVMRIFSRSHRHSLSGCLQQ